MLTVGSGYGWTGADPAHKGRRTLRRGTVVTVDRDNVVSTGKRHPAGWLRLSAYRANPPQRKTPETHAEDVRIGSPVAQLREGRLLRRFSQLLIGLVAYGTSMAFLVRSTMGAMPWDVLSLGLAHHFGLTLGSWTVIVAIIVVLLWVPLRQPPGAGTLCNIFVIGLSVDAVLGVLGPATTLWIQVAYLVIGVGLNGMATAAYVGVRLGPGPRDGLMTGLTKRTRLPLFLIRTGIEVTVVITGWLLGGPLGIGTFVYALLIGPLVHRLLPIFTVRPRRSA